MFAQSNTQGYKLAALALLSLVLMFADSRFDYLGRLRYGIAIAVTPLHLMADLPSRINETFNGFFKARHDLESENARLQEEVLMQQFRLQKLDHLEAENQRLNALLKASANVDDLAVRAQLIGESSNPFSKRVLINKGGNEGVYVGQPVIDAYGLMGQVVLVEPLTSWVLLITDPLHATPVQVNRNGVRAIAAGTPDSLHQLLLENVTVSTDIRVGDVMVTSGLDQHLPAGYPVGVVSSVNTNTGQMFAEIRVTPSAQLDRGRNVLLLYSAQEKRQPRRETTQAVDGASTAVPAAKAADATTQPATPKTIRGEDGDEERPNYEEYR